ncbi:MAG: hypothetical protein A2745_02020 [Candidatus Harrisonbacteria bacterium RIFCSPHIGHO2_01_FULL_44_13]|uniref:DUF4878 domain-containing protein n=1 Tax=Candidatus Harrisonbacteria bacterium RIFCSPLOWO2_01_FULL_44_18 TaxID=1798407 RepID=A0A1G1ZR79_9BACT|nr:MAG: hypothetical protein A2745_02020 [Candidatus Harrisonbacteria bacterium RIFCSPHIGHO2_01_FULL_44_13]OGY66337.1 MAG: hypothetical protein A3A16_00295 [Candidatus Harrisonbacteria bacterium RIFCSPLOWO2_01_FULL_44_18]
MNKRLFLFWGVLVAMVVVVGGSYLIWNKYFKYDLEKVYQEAERRYVEAMTADTYGGKTPQETLDMFVEALRAEDIELASKYFMLDENLSREKWANLLANVKDRGFLGKMSNDLGNYGDAGDVMEGYYTFSYYNDDGTVGLQMIMRFNSNAGVWKIESL